MVSEIDNIYWNRVVQFRGVMIVGDGISIEAFDTSGTLTVRTTLETGDSIPLSPDSMVSEAVTSTSNIPATGESYTVTARVGGSRLQQSFALL